MQQLVGGQIHE